MIAVASAGSGNIGSITNALRRTGKDFVVTDSPEKILAASHVIIPGVGHAGVWQKEFIDSGLSEAVKNVTAPTLGICLGMQVLGTEMEESNRPGLGIISEPISRLSQDAGKVPNIGWYKLIRSSTRLDHDLAKAFHIDDYFYFVHSYAFISSERALAYADSPHSIVAVVQKDNFFGCQFHPEKSGDAGRRFLEWFLNL